MAEENDPKYKVGYRKPPKHTQFKPGRSGNPKGRPRKSTTIEDDIEAELRSRIIVTEDGKPLKITKRRAIVKQHVNKALRGDTRSAELLLKRQHDPSDQQDNLGALLEEFREKNRRLPTKSVAEEDASIGPAGSTSSTDKEGEKS